MVAKRSLPPPTLPPLSVMLEDGVELPCWTYTQLDLLNRVNLKSRAVSLQTLLGPARCPTLLASSDRETLIAWILKTQCSAARAGGAMLTAADFGAPAGGSNAPDPLLTEAELRRLEAAGIEAPAQLEARRSGMTAEPFPFSSQAPPRHPLALPQTARNEFFYDERYTTVASEATSAAASNRARNRGSLKDVLFGEGEAPKAVAGYEINPPFQIAPPGFEPRAASTSASAFKPPPSAAYRDRESPYL